MIYFGKSLRTIKNPFRAGVIPFTISNQELEFLLPIDKRTREYCDFGGGCKIGETFIDAGLRELLEESCEIFNSPDGIGTLDLLESVAVSDLSTSVFFVYVDEKWIENAEDVFQENQKKYSFKKYKENIGIKWIHEEHFFNMAFDKENHCMWKKLQNFFIKNVKVSELKIYLMLLKEINSYFDSSELKEIIN